MTDAFGIIFAYGEAEGLRELATPRTSSSMPFGARYRALDFLLSNMVNAGIFSIGVIMREGYQSLLNHLGSGKDWELSRKREGLVLLPPFSYMSTASTAQSYATLRGKISALAGVESFVSQQRYKYAVLGDGHVIANMNISQVIDEHIRSGADITMVCTKPVGESASSVYVDCDEDGYVTEIENAPKSPGKHEAMGVYVLEKSTLLYMINYGTTHDLPQLENEVLRKLLPEMRVKSYLFDGYVAKIQTVEAYFRNNMELLDEKVRAQLFDRSNPVYSRVRDDMPAYYGDTSKVSNSLVADGCVIEGRVENSVLFRGVYVGAGATVKNSIIMQAGVLENNTFLNYVIADKSVRVSRDGMIVGSESYPVVIAKNAIV